MLRLPLGIRFGHQRAAQPITSIHQAEQALALPHAQGHAIAFLQASRETLSIPKVGLHLGRRRWLSHQRTHLLQLLGGESGRPPGMVAFGQTGQALQVKATHPID